MSEDIRQYKTEGKVVLSNYDDSTDVLRSWEAKVVKEK